MAQEEIKYSKEYLEILKKEIDKLEKNKAQLLRNKNEAYGGKSYQNAIDIAPSFRMIDEQIRAINFRIQEIKYRLDNVQTVEHHDTEGLVDFDRTYEIEVTTADGVSTTDFYRLIAESPTLNGDIPQISINSPLGKAIYSHKIGETVTFQTPNKQRRYATVLREIKENEDEVEQ